jgi:small-conductance mechanosensitive channel
MTRRWHRLVSRGLINWIVCCTLLCLLSSGGLAQDDGDHNPAPASEDNSIAIENPGAAVEVDGRPILLIYAQVGGFTPQERAQAIGQRIVALSKARAVPLDAIHAEERGTWTEILAGSNRIMGITEADSKAAERPRAELVAEYTEIIRQVVRQYREDHTVRRLLWATLYAFEATLACAVVILLLFWIRRRLRSKLDASLAHTTTADPAHAPGMKIGAYLGRPLMMIGRAAFWVIVLALLQAYGTVVLRCFPATRYASYQITNWVFSGLATFGKAAIGYMPKLTLLALILLITSSLVKLNAYVFGEIRNERLTIQGFYPDWAEPTAKLVRMLILAAGVIVAFPYLPGSDSPAFKGISVFLGVLLSLGSTSAVAHAVAGTILTYMRAFQVGDFVRIGSDVGEVVEKTLLVTRIKTQKSELITVPNGTVLGGVVVNYSAEARRRGVIFHTVVTIGYSAPWRQVHELLLSAALATDGVLHDPAPFVLQTGLSDFYVSYELNAYTATPGNMQNVYSLLHQNIQDRFNGAGVEINSPHYACLRDGNETTIPERYRPSGYKQAPPQVHQVDAPNTAAADNHEYCPE